MNVFMLAMRNVRKSFKDYGIYFLTLVIGVAIFYMFNSIESQDVMLELSENEVMMLFGLNRFMSYLSALISVLWGFLILYANAFLIRRRKKEIGIYMLLGMKKGKISLILICETMFVGLISLAVGLIVGVFGSQGLVLLTAKLFDVSLKGYVFVLSVSAICKSVIYFGIAFLVVMIFNILSINRQELNDLIYADKKTTRLYVSRAGIYVPLFIISIVMLILAYRLAISDGLVIISDNILIVVFLGISGTFLFFYAFSGFFLRVISKYESIYFNGLNLFTLGQLNSKIGSSHLSMSLVCLMLFLSISSISVGSALAESIKEGYGHAQAGIVALITYMSLYMGIVFMICCASIPAISQLCEASDNRASYLLLYKMGASEKILANSLFKQIFLYFTMPLILAIVHSIAAILVIRNLVMAIGEINILATSLISGLEVVAIYGGYFAVTFFSAKKIIIP